MNPERMKVTGDLGAALAVGKLTELGYAVAFPLQTGRYDFLIDKDGVLARVQVKTVTASQSSATLEVSTCTSGGTRGNVRRTYSRAEIDVLLVCWLDTRRWFWLDYREDASLSGKRQVTLRFDAPKIRTPHVSIRWACDVEV